MSLSRDMANYATDLDAADSFYTFLASGQLETREQIRRFELLRLAFFALKLRKLNEQVENEASARPKRREQEREFRRNLLRHVIFQQVLTLIRLDAREQAMQIIAACRR